MTLSGSEFLVKALDEQDPSVECVTDSAALFLHVAEAVKYLQECIDAGDSEFTEDNSGKLMKHLIKAGDWILAIDEPRFKATVDITLAEVSRLDG